MALLVTNTPGRHVFGPSRRFVLPAEARTSTKRGHGSASDLAEPFAAAVRVLPSCVPPATDSPRGPIVVLRRKFWYMKRHRTLTVKPDPASGIRGDNMASAAGEVTRLLAELEDGRPDAASQLVSLIYGKLHQLARRLLRHERPDHTLQATALVHEAYLRLVNQPQRTWQNRAHFIAVAAQVMRHILVDYARARGTAKRGTAPQKVPLKEPLVFTEEQSEELVSLDEALARLT